MPRKHSSSSDRHSGSGKLPRSRREKLQRCSMCKHHGYVAPSKSHRNRSCLKSSKRTKCISGEDSCKLSTSPGKRPQREEEKAALPQSMIDIKTLAEKTRERSMDKRLRREEERAASHQSTMNTSSLRERTRESSMDKRPRCDEDRAASRQSALDARSLRERTRERSMDKRPQCDEDRAASRQSVMDARRLRERTRECSMDNRTRCDEEGAASRQSVMDTRSLQERTRERSMDKRLRRDEERAASRQSVMDTRSLRKRTRERSMDKRPRCDGERAALRQSVMDARSLRERTRERSMDKRPPCDGERAASRQSVLDARSLEERTRRRSLDKWLRREEDRAASHQSMMDTRSQRARTRGCSRGSGSSYSITESYGTQETPPTSIWGALNSTEKSVPVQDNPTYLNWSHLEPMSDLYVDFMPHGNFFQTTQDQYAAPYGQGSSYSQVSLDPTYQYLPIYQDIYCGIYSRTPYRMSVASEPTSTGYLDSTLWGTPTIPHQVTFENQPRAMASLPEDMPPSCPNNEEQSTPRHSSLERIFAYDEEAFIDALLASPSNDRFSTSSSDSGLGGGL